MIPADANRYRPLPSPGLVWGENRTPSSAHFGDVYFSREGGLAESRYVFLEGCGLPAAWQNPPAFTVAELGFGTGLNFLATWEMWRRTRPPGARLHYIAVEGFPLTRAELATCLEAWPELRDLARELIRAYPEPQPGFHRLFLQDVTLTLLYGEVAVVLEQLEAEVDAWFLDGFAPEKNPSMWRGEVFAEITRLSRQSARLATFSAASAVRRGLDEAGFDVEKVHGFGHKREMSRARFRGQKSSTRLQPWFAKAPIRQTGHAAIIGAGIAGTSVAHALHRRGWRTTIVDRRSALADAASGNPVGVLMPRLTAARNFDGRFYAAAWRFVLGTLEKNGGGLLQLATDGAEAARQDAIATKGLLPASLVATVTAQEASDIAGCAVPYGALYFPQGGWLKPRDVCAGLAVGSRVLLNTDVAALRYDGIWGLLDAAGHVYAEADVVILANALDAAALPLTRWMSLKARRGQITMAAPSAVSKSLRTVLTYGGYITPVHEGLHCVGATFDHGTDISVDDDSHHRNLADLARVLPNMMTEIDLRQMSGRVGLRCTTLDHLPLAGAVPDHAAYLRDFAELRHGHPWARYADAIYQPGLYTLTGLGARGLVSAPLAAELVAAQITGEPWPIERDLSTALHPGRFLVRDLKRREA